MKIGASTDRTELWWTWLTASPSAISFRWRQFDFLNPLSSLACSPVGRAIADWHWLVVRANEMCKSVRSRVSTSKGTYFALLMQYLMIKSRQHTYYYTCLIWIDRTKFTVTIRSWVRCRSVTKFLALRCVSFFTEIEFLGSIRYCCIIFSGVSATWPCYLSLMTKRLLPTSISWYRLIGCWRDSPTDQRRFWFGDLSSTVAISFLLITRCHSPRTHLCRWRTTTAVLFSGSCDFGLCVGFRFDRCR